MIPPLPSDIDPEFPAALVAGARELGADPLGVAAVLWIEGAGIHHAAVNPNSGAVGINQFDPPQQVLKYGFSSVEEYRQSSACEQFTRATMPFWRAMVHQFGRGETSFSARDIYWLNFLPATFVPNASEDHVVTSNPSYVSANPGLARGKSYITAGDFTAVVDAALNNKSSRWLAIKANIEAVDQTPPSGIATGATLVGGLGLVGFGFALMKGWIG